MRVFALPLLFLLVAMVTAQTPSASLMGKAATVAPDHIVVQTGAGTATLYANDATKVWRGQTGNVLTIVRPGDDVLARYRPDPVHPVIVDIYANIAHVWGRITAVTSAGFEVDQNFNADPQSAYRRGTRQIAVAPGTEFEASAREDLRIGRTVDIIGLKTSDSVVEATRVIVYDDHGSPVRMPAGGRVTLPNGEIRN